MKKLLIFAILFCVHTFVMSMDKKDLLVISDQNKIKPINDARFGLDSKKCIISRNITGVSYHFLNGQKAEDGENVFSCLILTENDMRAVKNAFQLLDEGSSISAEFSLPDRPVKCSLAVHYADSEKRYFLKFEKEKRLQ